MRVPLLLLLTIFLAVYGKPKVREEAPPFSVGNVYTFRLTGRIVNGTKAVLRQFPHQMSLRRSWSDAHFCGGVLISTKHVLSAGHCMYLGGVVIQPWTIVVVGGGLVLDQTVATNQKRGVDKILVHPEFDMSTLQNDISLLLLKVAFKMTPELKSAPLPLSLPIPGSVCQVSGWGYPDENVPEATNDLLYVDLPIITQSKCRQLLINVTDFPPGMYCAGYLEGGRDACQGDSGGGMVCNGVLTGIVSGGEGCAHPRLPGVYSDVFFYRNWVSSHVTLGQGLTPRQPNNGTESTKNFSTILFSILVFASVLYL